MSQSDVHLLDLPNELLFIILNKLGNVNVLYSLLNVINRRFNSLLQDSVFTNTLNLTKPSSDYVGNSSLDDPVINRFCSDILPIIHLNVKHLTLNSISMKRILLSGDYPKLTSLKLFQFNQNIAFSYFTDQSIFRHIFKYQITKLNLENHDDECNNMGILLKDYTADVYAPILTFFENLKHFSIVSPSFLGDYLPLSIYNLPSTIFSSSILTELCIDVDKFDDCLCLLDGRLQQLTTLIVRIHHIDNHSSIIHKSNDDLPNLKHFSLKCYDKTDIYDTQILPLLHRMTNLEKLTLYLRLRHRHKFIDGTHLHQQIRLHMQRLHTFIFYISTEIEIDDSVYHPSINDIQQTFINIGYHQMACTVNYYSKFKAICHIFSLPFVFDRLEEFCNKFPPVIYDRVIELEIFATLPFSEEFLDRIVQAFPLLKHLSIITAQLPPSYFDPDNAEYMHSIALMRHLSISTLSISYGHDYHIEPNS